MALGPIFPTANNFSWVGIDFTQETDYKKPTSIMFSANTVMVGQNVLLVQYGTGPSLVAVCASQQYRHYSGKRRNSAPC